MREGAVVDAWIAHLAPTAARRERLRDGNVHDLRPDDRSKRDRSVRRLKRRIGLLVARNPANAHAQRKQPKKLKRTRDGKAVGKIVEVDGGFRKGVRLVRSACVRRIEAQVAEIARGDAAARDTDHGRVANQLLTSAATIALEKLSYRGWQQQFGRQAGRAAVGVLVERLRRRAPVFDARQVVELSPFERLSQVCHACGALNPYLDELAKPVAARTSCCEGCGRANAQLDLYSAFLAASCGEGTSVDRDVATAAWPGAVELLASARQTYERAVRAALAARRAQALRPSRRNPSGSSQDSASRGLRSQTHAQRGDGPPRERAGGGNAMRNRSSEAGQVSPPHAPGSPEPGKARAGPSLDSCDVTPTATRAP